ncbi:hypothetical protein M4D57_21285, partial [Brevibacillus borstelensis]|uniref:hypothetical protein n=1 Tax=Brevibacillus borstelensis TaxID=45462 RepID=UPI002040B2EB
LSRAFKDRDHEKVTHPTGGLIFAMVVNFLMSTVVNILIDIHSHAVLERLRFSAGWRGCVHIDMPSIVEMISRVAQQMIPAILPASRCTL